MPSTKKGVKFAEDDDVDMSDDNDDEEEDGGLFLNPLLQGGKGGKK